MSASDSPTDASLDWAQSLTGTGEEFKLDGFRRLFLPSTGKNCQLTDALLSQMEQVKMESAG
jgi:hypothetical protein